MGVFTRRSYTYSSLVQLLLTILSLYQVDVQTKHARHDEKHFKSTKRINKKDELERSTSGNITRTRALQTSRKTNAREYTIEKSKPLATTYRFEMMLILEILQTLQTLRYNRSRKIISSKHNIFSTSLVSLSTHPRSRQGAQRIKKGEGRWNRPPKTLTCFIRSSPADIKQNKLKIRFRPIYY